jgi:SAM-dependent methyltransferase
MTEPKLSREEARARARKLAEEFLAKQGGQAWFDELYKRAEGDASVVPWADIAPDPLLIDWLTAHFQPPVQARALVIGCGLGDDAEELADWGFKVTAFDLSATAVDWCRDRFEGTSVKYECADILDPPATFAAGFDFVLEDSTLQTMQGESLAHAVANLPGLLAPGGMLLIICRARDEYELLQNTPPWPLTRSDLRPIEAAGGLKRVQFEDFYDHEEPPVRRFRVAYTRPKSG